MQFASRLSLIAFATASIRGLLHGADFQGTLQTAIAAGVVFFGLGLGLGELARWLVEENVQLEIARLKAENSEPNPEGS